MVGMATNKSIGSIRGKDNVNGLGSPRKEVINIMGQCGRNGSQQAYEIQGRSQDLKLGGGAGQKYKQKKKLKL